MAEIAAAPDRSAPSAQAPRGRGQFDHRVTGGAIQYVERGEGTPVFVSHGVLGGHDNVRELVDLWFGPQYRAIGAPIPPTTRQLRASAKPF